MTQMMQLLFGPFCAVMGMGMGAGMVVACVDGGKVVVEERGGERRGSSGRINNGGGAGDIAVCFVMHCHTKVT
jgi:hypothetical protein